MSGNCGRERTLPSSRLTTLDAPHLARGEAIPGSRPMQPSAAVGLAPVVTAGAGSAAAEVRHAPSLAAVARSVQEQPAAVAADLHPLCGFREREFEGGVEHRAGELRAWPGERIRIKRDEIRPA